MPATTTNGAQATVAREALGQGATSSRVERIRTLSATDPAAARDDAWAWIQELGRRARRDRDGALVELADLFRAGRPSTSIEGQTEGTLVTFTIHPAVDAFIAAITAAWLPWAGKRFDRARSAGDNLLLRSARWPAKLLWPVYRLRDAAEHLSAFDFETRVEPGAIDPEVEVLVIDYAPVDENPRVLIKSIRDELVEIAPGANLGKMLWTGRNGHALLAYFALKSSLDG